MTRKELNIKAEDQGTQEQSQDPEALRELLDRRRNGKFVSLDEGQERTKAMIDRKRAERGL